MFMIYVATRSKEETTYEEDSDRFGCGARRYDCCGARNDSGQGNESKFVGRFFYLYLPPEACPGNQTQDFTCLDANGAISANGYINPYAAQSLAEAGICTCDQDLTGEVVGTDAGGSFGGDQSSFMDLVANHHALLGSHYNRVLLRSYDPKGAAVSARFFKPAGMTVSNLRAEMSAFMKLAIQKGATRFLFITGASRKGADTCLNEAR